MVRIVCPWFATKCLVYALSGPRAILLLGNAKSRLYFIWTIRKPAWFSIVTKPSSTSGQSLLESPSILINTLLPPLKNNNNAFFLFCISEEQFTAALVWHSAAWWELGLCIVSTHSFAVWEWEVNGDLPLSISDTQCLSAYGGFCNLNSIFSFVHAWSRCIRFAFFKLDLWNICFHIPLVDKLSDMERWPCATFNTIVQD